MKTIAIIPARGGSKGIPGKNIIPLLGKPLIAWNILAAKASEKIDGVFVSTDDAGIAAVAREYGAEVIDRPDEIAGDTASSESALLHALAVLAEQGILPELLVFLQCTSPLTQTRDIDRALATLAAEGGDSCVSACDFHYFVWARGADGDARGMNHDKRFRQRRQDREPQYLENGAIYVMKREGFLHAGHRFFGKTVISPMPAERSFEIDDPVDLKIAEVLLAESQSQS